MWSREKYSWKHLGIICMRTLTSVISFFKVFSHISLMMHILYVISQEIYQKHWLDFFKKIVYFYFIDMPVCPPCVWSAWISQKGASDLLELELLAVMNCHVVAGKLVQLLWKSRKYSWLLSHLSNLYIF